MRQILFLFAMLTAISVCEAQIVPAPTEKQAQAIEKIMAPQRAKIKALVDADKSGRYEAYQKDVKALFETEDLESRSDLEAKIRRDHYAYLKSIFTEAGINLAELKRQISGILGNSKFDMDEFGGISSASVLPPGALPSGFSAEFACPLTARQAESNCTLVNSPCGAKAEECKIDIEVLPMGAGGARSKGSVGGRFDLTGAAATKMTVSAQGHVYYSGGAESLLLGYSQFNAKVGVRLQGPGLDKTIITRDEWCIAPLLYFKYITFSAQDYLMQGTFNGNFASGVNYTAQAYAEVFGLAVGLASGGGACRVDQFDFVKAKATN